MFSMLLPSLAAALQRDDYSMNVLRGIDFATPRSWHILRRVGISLKINF